MIQAWIMDLVFVRWWLTQAFKKILMPKATLVSFNFNQEID